MFLCIASHFDGIGRHDFGKEFWGHDGQEVEDLMGRQDLGAV